MKHFENITPQVVPHFYNGEWIGDLNEYENLSLRVRIAEGALEGYTIFFNEKHFDILKNGKIDNWPLGLYEDLLTMSSKLFKAQRKQK